MIDLFSSTVTCLLYQMYKWSEFHVHYMLYDSPDMNSHKLAKLVQFFLNLLCEHVDLMRWSN